MFNFMYCSMRKTIAILFVAVFFTMQYGRLVNYWHCKIVAVVKAARCDCEKVLVDAHTSGIDHSTTSAVTDKIEEVYWLRESEMGVNPIVAIQSDNFPSYTSHLPEITGSSPFQPPRA
jgi:hypothetical protein